MTQPVEEKSETDSFSFKIKHYLHFGPNQNKEKLQEIAFRPKNVIKHSFLPLISEDQSSVKWSKVSEAFGDADFHSFCNKDYVKIRPIKYASHIDSAIYQYYRFLLGNKYEAFVAENEINHNVIAYRKLKKEDGGGKCNIDFAKEAFDFLKNNPNTIISTHDIQTYFDKINHSILKQKIIEVLGQRDKLERDWEKVFNSITRHCWVSFSDIALFLSNEKDASANSETTIKRVKRKLYKEKKEGLRKTLLDNPKQFQSLLNKCFDRKYTLFEEVEKGQKKQKISSRKCLHINYNPYGIPQGLPISDMLANVYLKDFDVFAKKLIEDDNKGFYRRYSDDLLIILPEKYADEVNKAIQDEIKKLEVKINESKTEQAYFCGEYLWENKEKETKKSIQYLGFSFDGEKTKIRGSTLDNFYAKSFRYLKCQAILYLNGYEEGKMSFKEDGTLDDKYLAGVFSKVLLMKSRSRTRIARYKFDNKNTATETDENIYHEIKQLEGELRNFFTYVKKSSKVFETDFKKEQLSHWRKLSRKKMRKYIADRINRKKLKFKIGSNFLK